MKNMIIILLSFLSFFAVTNTYLYSATACSATADNGSSCSSNCTGNQIAHCVAGAHSAVCYCTDPATEPNDDQNHFTLTNFADGERSYFINDLKPFILSLGTQAATNLALALDDVISAIDNMDGTAYNAAEYNYHDKRALLSTSEIEQLNQWVATNGFYK